eukprot:1179447-Prorocentrum_minimum.AAC.1
MSVITVRRIRRLGVPIWWYLRSGVAVTPTKCACLSPKERDMGSPGKLSPFLYTRHGPPPLAWLTWPPALRMRSRSDGTFARCSLESSFAPVLPSSCT